MAGSQVPLVPWIVGVSMVAPSFLVAKGRLLSPREADTEGVFCWTLSPKYSSDAFFHQEWMGRLLLPAFPVPLTPLLVPLDKYVAHCCSLAGRFWVPIELRFLDHSGLKL